MHGIKLMHTFVFCYVIDRDDNAHVILKFLEDERRVRETVQGREYRIRAEFTKPNGIHSIDTTIAMEEWN